MIELMKHQKEAVEFFKSTNGRALFFMKPGQGKTFAACEVLRRCLMNRKNWNTAVSGGVLILCPASLVAQWEKELVRYLTPEEISCITVTNYEKLNIKEYGQPLLKTDWLLIVADECFPYDTKVITDRGILPIGYIVENNINCGVLSCNLSSNVLEYKKVVRRIKKSNNNGLIKIKHEFGEIICTPNHKIYIEELNEYVQGEKIRSGTHLRVVQEEFYGDKSGEENTTFLWVQLLKLLQKLYTRIHKKPSESYPTRDSMWLVQGSFSSQKKIQQRPFLLFFNMCVKTLKGIADISRQIYQRVCQKTFIVNDRALQESSRAKKESIGKNEKEQPDVQPRDSRENETKKNRLYIFKSWWKFSNNKTTKNIGRCSWFTRFYGAPNKNSTCKKLIRVIADLLQGRYSHTRENACDRGGWEDTQNQEVEVLRPSQGGGFKFSRVESIEVLERGDRQQSARSFNKDTPVYNLEVEDNHNYFANGVLVSNCHMTNNPTAKRTKVFKKLKTRYKCALSGTPFPNAEHEAYSLIDWFEPGVLGRTYTEFKAQWCNVHPQFYTILGIRKELQTTFRTLIAKYTYRTDDDVLIDLPPKATRTITLSLPPAHREAYQKLKTELMATIDGKKVTIPNALSLISYLRKAVDCPQEVGIPHESPKLSVVLDVLRESDKSTIIFVEHKQSAFDIQYRIDCEYAEMDITGKTAVITSSTPQGKRNKIMQSFQAGAIDVLIGTSALSTGLNLQRATRVIHYSTPWNGARIDQRVARAWRHGQTQEVEEIFLVCGNSIDIQISNLISKKRVVEQRFTKTELLSLLK